MAELFKISIFSFSREQRRARLEGKQDWEVEVEPSTILKEAYTKQDYIKENYIKEDYIKEACIKEDNIKETY